VTGESSEPLAAQDLPDQVRELAGEPLRLSFPRQGETSAVAVVAGRRHKLVVKRARGEQFSSWLAQERRVLFVLPELPFRVPRVRLLCQTGTPFEPESWLVTDFIPGEPMREALTRTAGRDERAGLLRAWGATLSAIHRAPVPLGLAVAGHTWLARMLDEAERNLSLLRADDGTPAKLTRLRNEALDPVPLTLIHGDFTLDNTLVENGAITGIVDWPLGAWGDPRYDLALATRPEREAFRARGDAAAFYEGYAGRRLTARDARYFLRLYDFF
jgi:aminoglycoside phosphotransferase (APT) family kinase protein